MSTLHFSPRANRADQINWRPWGDAAFAEAKEQGKPILLAISAVWCHWCHVMDETSYSDPAVIERINSEFIPVRVDNDQRPDVNARYNMGGWPTTAFLTADGEVLYGGTYIPPDAMRQVLSQIDSFYSQPDNRLAIAKRTLEIKTVRAARARTPQGADLDPNTAANIFETLSSSFDEEYGGFGTDQKFPHVSALAFALDYWQRNRDQRAQTIVQRSLRAMADGGMYDHVEGGFFRYSTTRDFSVPHFEKMLEDLGGLLLACARASSMFGDAHLAEVAVDVKRYLDDRLWNDKTKGYGGSQDADEQYYELDAAGRATMAEPFVDTTLYTSWNAQAAYGLLRGGALLEANGVRTRPWVERAVVILDTLWSKMLVDGLMCRYYDGEPHVRGLFVDQAWSAWAAVTAFETTGDNRWLQRANALVERTELLYDRTFEGYLDRVLSAHDPGRIAEQTVPMEENALMARVLLALASHDARPSYRERAVAMLRRFASDYQSFGLFASPYGSATFDVLAPPIDIRVVGPSGDASTIELRKAALAIAAPAVRVCPLDPAMEESRATALGHGDSAPAAYLCNDHTCFARATSPDELRAAVYSPAVSRSL